MKTHLSALYKTVIVLLFVGIMTVLAQVQAQPFSLKPLASNRVAPEIDANGLVTVAMIYQPDCSWCKKQGKILERAFNQCKKSMNIALVGTKGNTRQLRKELKHYHDDIPAFIADRKFLRDIGGYQASPTTLIYNEEGKLIVKKRGFIPEQKLASALAVISKDACHI
jgi:thioredoxin-related protein